MTRVNLAVTKKQLRSCSATVFTAKRVDGTNLYLLRSYGSNVMEIFPDDRGGWNVTLLPRWNYSNTTNSHVRKFMQDVTGDYVSVPDFRDIIKCQKEAGIGRHGNYHVAFGERWQKSCKTFWENCGVYGEWGF